MSEERRLEEGPEGSAIFWRPAAVSDDWSISHASVIDEAGGALDLLRFRKSGQIVIAQVFEFAAYWFNLWKEGPGMAWRSLRLVATNGRSCNAFVSYDGCSNIIGLHAGLALRLGALLGRIRGNAKLSGSLDLLPSDDLSPKLRNKSSILIDDCVRWVMMHELAHIARGHLFALSAASLNATLSEARTKKVREESELTRFFENDADAVGMDFTVILAESSRVKHWSKSKRIVRFRNLLVAVGLAMLLLDRSDLPLRRNRSVANPHPFVRLLLMLDFAAASAEREFGLTFNDVVACSKDALSIITEISQVIGYRSPVWSLGLAALYRQALTIQEVEKENLIAMGKVWFSGRSTLAPKGYIR